MMMTAFMRATHIHQDRTQTQHDTSTVRMRDQEVGTNAAGAHCGDSKASFPPTLRLLPSHSLCMQHHFILCAPSARTYVLVDIGDEGAEEALAAHARSARGEVCKAKISGDIYKRPPLSPYCSLPLSFHSLCMQHHVILCTPPRHGPMCSSMSVTKGLRKRSPPTPDRRAAKMQKRSGGSQIKRITSLVTARLI
jgi:hypothetical protein